MDRPSAETATSCSMSTTTREPAPRALLEWVGGFDERIPTGAEDADLAMRALEAGAGAAFAPEALMNHGVLEHSLIDAVRFTTRWRTLPAVVGRHPPLRRAFPWRG